MQGSTEFHDRWAASTGLNSIRVKEAFEAPTAMENKFILTAMGPRVKLAWWLAWNVVMYGTKPLKLVN
jgi:hypothetical protein